MISGNAFAVMMYPIVGILFFYLWKRREWTGTRVFFALIFTAYAVEVFKVTLFPLPIDGVMARDFAEVPFWGFLNLVPFGDLTTETLRTQFAPNVLLAVPFGFGAWFVLRRPTLRAILVAGIAAALSIELLQLAIGAAIGVMYRSVDINDPIANTIGVLAGVAAFGLFGVAFRWLDSEVPNGDAGILNHVRKVVSLYKVGNPVTSELDPTGAYGDQEALANAVDIAPTSSRPPKVGGRESPYSGLGIGH